MKTKMYRSRLVIPINQDRYVAKAHTRDADLYVLDLEDSIPSNEKEQARELVKKQTKLLKERGLIVYVRINNDENIKKDLLAVAMSEADGIMLPKVETIEDIQNVESFLQKHMSAKQYEGFSISILIESIKGYVNLAEILSCSTKIDTASYGMEDLAAEIGFTYTAQNEKYLNDMRMQLIMLSKLNGVKPMGLIGSITNFSDLKLFRQSAEEAYSIGYEGSSCIHPEQVKILNESFRPSAKQMQEVRELIHVFEAALKQGRASATFQGKMIDYPHYESAKKLLHQFADSEGSS